MSGTEILRRCRNRSDGIRESASPLALLRTARLLQRFVAGMIYSIVVSVWAACVCIRHVIFLFLFVREIKLPDAPSRKTETGDVNYTKKKKKRKKKTNVDESLCIKQLLQLGN